VGAVDLGEDVPGVNEKDTVVSLAFVKEPERGRQCDCVEHIRGQGQHGIDEVFLNQPLADFRFGMARIRGGISHYKRGPAFWL
jgi:hypothetical protein